MCLLIYPDIVVPPPAGLLGAERLISVFGSWPSFHDAEVIRLALDRAAPTSSKHEGPTIALSVRVFTFGPDVAPTGAYVHHNETLATILFGDVRNLELSGFNQQNVLTGLHIENIRSRQLEGLSYEVTLAGSFGVDAFFQCGTIEIVAAESWFEPT